MKHVLNKIKIHSIQSLDKMSIYHVRQDGFQKQRAGFEHASPFINKAIVHITSTCASLIQYVVVLPFKTIAWNKLLFFETFLFFTLLIRKQPIHFSTSLIMIQFNCFENGSHYFQNSDSL